MPFVLRPYRRLPVVSSVTYEQGPRIVWNLSPAGWRLTGNLPLQPGDICSLSVILPTNTPVSVSAAIVRWVRGESSLETLVMNGMAQAQLGNYVRACMKAV
jgi:hypothetical protein